MSSSLNKSIERIKGGKLIRNSRLNFIEAKLSRRGSKISEYSEDFEALSEENF